MTTLTKTEIEANAKASAQIAMRKLTQYREHYKQGKITRELLKKLVALYIEDYDRYNSIVAKRHGLKPRKFNLLAFLR